MKNRTEMLLVGAVAGAIVALGVAGFLRKRRRRAMLRYQVENMERMDAAREEFRSGCVSGFPYDDDEDDS